MFSRNNDPEIANRYDEKDKNVASAAPLERTASAPSSLGKGEVFSLESIDPALNAKMRLVNNVRYNTLIYLVDSGMRILIKT